MAFDKMDWHAVNFPDSIAYECAGTHMGMYLAWLIENDLIEEEWFGEFDAEMQKVKNREMTGRDLLIECFDESLIEDLMTDEALEFTAEYYDSHYIDDYADVLGNDSADCEFAVYLHEDTWENYDRVEPLISAKFEKWKNKQFD
ncbi:MAG: hypothetical protein VB081_00565 [Christensenella sp.]|uniref:DUF7832 domain-containing protein n=1 Tax=Christensenella sp. TaxID=1935934 RepID=UPI002B1FBA1B|nr:hypothetical protein [Christensenella sp.]MEA5001981.1 hypothetical protein [Christensenella sp.]